MPSRPPRPCRHKGCRATTTEPHGYCDEHIDKPKKKPVVLTHDRLERKRFYQRIVWKRLRAERLSIEPLCRNCRKAGRLTEATIVDHITPFFMPDDALATDPNNLQSLCVSCHNAKTNTKYRVVNGLSGRVGHSSDTGQSINANHTQEARRMRLKGYGNAIVHQVAAEFIKEFTLMENQK